MVSRRLPLYVRDLSDGERLKLDRESAIIRTRFGAYLTISFLADTGYWIAIVAQGWLVEQLTHAPLWLGIIAAAAQAPSLLFSVLGGTLADRVDRRTALAWINGLVAVVALATAVAVATHVVTVWLLLALSFATGTLIALEHPLDRTLLYDLIEGRDVGRSIALSSLEFSFSRVAGPALGGIAIAAVGIALGYALFAALVLPYVVFAIVLIVRGSAGGDRPDAAAADTSFDDSTAWFVRERSILQFAAFTFVFVLGTAPYQSLLPDLADRALRVGERGFGLLSAAAGIGAVASAALLARAGETQRKAIIVPLAALAAGIATLALAVARNPYAAGAALLVLGASDSLVYALVNTYVQERSAARYRGRGNALFSIAFLGAIPIGNAIAGVCASRIGTEATLVASGALVIAAGAAFLAFGGETRRIERAA